MNDVIEHSSPKKVKKNRLLFVWGFLLCIAVIAVLLVGFDIYRIYTVRADDRVSVAIARTLHLPIAKVDGGVILYSDYMDDLKALKSMIAYDVANNPDPNMPQYTEDQLSDQVLLRLAGNILLNEAAKKYDVKVEDKDKDSLKHQMLQQFKPPSSTPSLTPTDFAAASTDEAAEKKAGEEIQKRYGWTLKQYEQKVMVPYILQNKTSKKLAEDILDQIKKGANFEDMAKKYSEDGSAAQGGDLGWFGKGEMVPEFDQVAFSLQKGEVAPNVVESQYGYHIIKVEDKKTEEVKDDKGKMVQKEEVKARHILFSFPGLQRYIDERIPEVKVKLYANLHNPFVNYGKSS